MDKVIICAGPTASGKSAFALQLAREQHGVILNGDSLQVYKHLEILTAQPSYEDQKSIPHRLYGCLEPWETCSAGHWLSLILPEIQKAHKSGQLPLVVGGTGFYLKALQEGLSPIPTIDPTIRQKLREREETQDKLYQDLQRVDSTLAAHINPQDQQRTLRGLEVFYGTGKPLSFWQTQKPTPLPYEFETILFIPPKETLIERMRIRLDKMLAEGVLDEVEKTLKLSLSVTAKKAIGLQEFSNYLKRLCSLEEAKGLTLLHTWQYAKRQRTWFRNQ